MHKIKDWCISRQLWWGHRIPARYDADGRVYVARSEEEARAKYGIAPSSVLHQDEDVLDTWFSSALWPFSTLGWPEETDDLARFYPTHTLVTGFDIIFYWVARMMMMGLHFTGRAPFRRVVINALIRDADGAKMSKSKGNVMDPLELIELYGADALRFTLTAMSGQARDIRLSTQRIEGYRNFSTKVWSAARFCEMNGCVAEPGFDPGAVQGTLNRWMVGETARAAAAVTRALEDCAFDDAAASLYRFIWNVYCDWGLELAKPILGGADEIAKAETGATLAWTLETILRLLHPVMPFVTEELWDKTASAAAPRRGLLITETWPEVSQAWIDPAAGAEVGWLIDLITEVRQLRAEMGVPPAAKPALWLVGAGEAARGRLECHRDLILTLGRVQSADVVEAAPPGSALFVIGDATGALAIAGHIDLAAERTRLAKELASREADIDRTAKKLANADFLARAPEAVVEENRGRLKEAELARAKLQGALARLAAMT
jgi:valyl-tRNA synthetase